MHSVIEEERETEVEEVRAVASKNKKALEDKLSVLETEIAAKRDAWNETFDAAFLSATEVNAAGGPASDLSPEEQAELQAQKDEATATYREKIAGVDKQIATHTADYKKIQSELDHWQVEFERELRASR